MAEPTDVVAAALGRMAVQSQDDCPRRLRRLLRFDQRAKPNPKSIGFLEDDLHQPDQQLRGQLASRKPRSGCIPDGGSFSRPK